MVCHAFAWISRKLKANRQQSSTPYLKITIMWKRKTILELENEKLELNEPISNNRFRKALKTSIYVFLGVLAFVILASLLGINGNKHTPGATPDKISTSELPQHLTICAIVSFIAAVIVFLISLFAPKFTIRSANTTLICDKCFKVKNPDNTLNCDCGGCYENLDLYKWVED